MKMRRKSRKRAARSIFIVGLCVLLTLGAGGFPLIYFHLSDKAQLRALHPRDNPAAKIDAQAEDIYLVGAVRSLYSGDGSSLNTETVTTLFPGAFEELLEAGQFPAEYRSFLPAEAVYYTSVAVDDEKTLHHYVAFATVPAAEGPFISFQLEEKTEKLIFLGVGKKGLQKSLTLPDREALMDGYLRYLGLDVLSDWKENEIGQMSAKAQMQMYCLMNEDALLLCVAPIGFFDNNRLNDMMSSLLARQELLPTG